MHQVQPLAYVAQRHAGAGRDARACSGLSIVITAPRRRSRVRTRIVPPSGAGSMPWRTAFSTSGCSSSGGTRACEAAGSRSQLTLSRSPSALADREIALRELDFSAKRDGGVGVGKRDTKQLGQILEQLFGPLDRCAPARSRC